MQSISNGASFELRRIMQSAGWNAYTGRRTGDVPYPLPLHPTNRGRLNQVDMPKTISKNTAAAEVRHKILRKMDELDKTELDEGRWESLRRYIRGMARRASSKKGGLGRR